MCPLRAWAFVWQTQGATFAQAIVVKATFVVLPGECTLAPDQDEPCSEDSFWNDDPGRSVVVPSDKAPYKPRADVMLVGHAFAANKQPVRSLVARLLVGELDKSIEVFCDRRFRSRDGQLVEGSRFTQMPLRWERCAGGPETNNPVGMRFDAQPDAYGMVAVPNLQPVGTFVSTRSDTFAPIGFGPIAPTWPGRTLRLAHLSSTFSASDWETRRLPEGFDPSFFQAAPADQQIGGIRPDERIVLEHLHVEHARLVTRLPGVRPVVVVDRATGEHEQVTLAADTLWFDTDRGVCTVVWRGCIGLRHAQEAGRITVTLEDTKAPARGSVSGKAMTQPLGSSMADDDDDPATRTCALGFGAAKAEAAVLPFSGAARSGAAGAVMESKAAVTDGALPFGASKDVAAHRVHASLPVVGANTLTPPKAPEGVVRAPPLLRSMSSDAVAPPAIVTTPPLLDAIAPPVGHSPWAPTDNAAGVRPAPMSIGQLLASSTDTPAAQNVDKPAPAMVPGPMGADELDKRLVVKDAALGGAGSASNAAAEEAGRGGRKLWTGRVAVDLIWANAGSMARIRKHAAWKDVLGSVKVRPDDDDVDDDLPPARRLAGKDRRDVLAVLSRGEPLDAMGIEGALLQALDDEGGFTPPLVLAGGELVMRYDELETLKATLSALAPHAGSDKRLEEATARVQEMFKMPWVQGANGVLEETTSQLKKLFADVCKGMALDRFEWQIEQTLLEGRHYRKRTVFGQPRLVGVLWSPGGKQSVPVYMPEHLSKELPTLRRMVVRLIGDVRPRAEEAEKSAAALRVVAMGRGVG